MKKIITLPMIAIVLFLFTTSCSKKALPTIIPPVQKNIEDWRQYDFKIKEIIDQYGAEKAQFAIESEISIANKKDTIFLNSRGDVVDSTITDSRFIPAKTLCLFVSSKIGVDGSTIYKMEFLMKKTDELIYLYFTGKQNINSGKFTVQYVPANTGKVFVAFDKEELPTLWYAEIVGQKLLYSKKSGTDLNHDNAIDNKLPGR
jgi:predicted small secreted protein